MNVINVYLSHSTYDAVSRLQLIEWLNTHVRKRVTSIEEMGDGTIYCFMLHRLFHGSVPLDKVILSPKLEYQKRFNFRILQAAFRKLGVQKQLNIDKLVAGKFQDNLDFIQWFYKFYEINAQYQLECKEKKDKKQQRSITMPLIEPPAADIEEDEKEFKTLDYLANDIDQYELDLLCTGSEVERKQLARDMYKRILTHIEKLLEKQCERFHVLRRAFFILAQIMQIKENIVKLDNDETEADKMDV